MTFASGEELQRQQFRLAFEDTDLTLEQVWMAYFSIGGASGLVEIQAYCYGALSLPGLERDLLAHALNETLDSRGANGRRASYGHDTLGGQNDAET
ncbi:hypothetical protein [Paenarthrobacter sp. CAP02]|uniref:hypothetical protein n=1 Tax=Paenarthrobacter sp. CAP02 TaxID=3158144 RepID=UPI0032DA41C0